VRAGSFLYDWQTLLAGLIAIAAAGIAVGGAEFFARRRANREIDAIRLSLAIEIRWLIAVLLETHQVLTRLSGKGAGILSRDVENLTGCPTSAPLRRI
jgi:hypothetical protein